MTRKDYQLIASAIARWRSRLPSSVEATGFAAGLTQEMADTLKEDNRHFDKGKFFLFVEEQMTRRPV